MEYRKIGSLEVSVVGLGTNSFGSRLDRERAGEVVLGALDAGVNFIDTAESYGRGESEEIIGHALKGRREEAIIATKFAGSAAPPGSASAAAARSSLEASLRRLSTDRIDLYILHSPHPETPIAETLAALNDFVDEGKVREIGCSNRNLEQLKEVEAAPAEGQANFVNLQNQYSLIQRADGHDVLPECERAGIAFVPYSPLANGLLTGKYHRNEPPPEGSRLAIRPTDWRGVPILTDENLETVEKLRSFCEQRGRTLLELAMSWLLSCPAVASVISGATSPEQVKANASATGWDLSDEDLAEIDQLAPLR